MSDAEWSEVAPEVQLALDAGHSPRFVADFVSDKLPMSHIQYRARFISARLKRLPPVQAERPRMPDPALTMHAAAAARRLSDEEQAARAAAVRAALRGGRPPAEEDLVPADGPDELPGQLAVRMPGER